MSSLREFVGSVIGLLTNKKVATLLVVALALVYLIVKAQQARRNERQRSQLQARAQSADGWQPVQRQVVRPVGPERFLVPRGPASKLKVAVALQALLGPVLDNEWKPFTATTLAELEVDPELAGLVDSLARCCDFYLVILVADEQEQDLIRAHAEAMLRAAGLCAGVLPSHRILCCATRKGQCAIFRQLDATLTVTASASEASELVAHLPEVLLVGSTAAPVPKLKCLPSFAKYFETSAATRLQGAPGNSLGPKQRRVPQP